MFSVFWDLAHSKAVKRRAQIFPDRLVRSLSVVPKLEELVEASSFPSHL